jgi:hypothetical protein
LCFVSIVGFFIKPLNSFDDKPESEVIRQAAFEGTLISTSDTPVETSTLVVASGWPSLTWNDAAPPFMIKF